MHKEKAIIEPVVSVGIMFEPQIHFVFMGSYMQENTLCSGEYNATYSSGKILFDGKLYDELLFEPILSSTASFELYDVTIGLNFHWERKEDQLFSGALKIIVENDGLAAINILPVEDYLTSVISSEMSATASLELLKSHAVISRSWLLAQIEKNKKINIQEEKYSAYTLTGTELIRWYDREDHINFDVCADDHCQRYQGITRASTEIVRQAIGTTRGQVLTFGGDICDARFSKCCGGALEEFQNCWEDVKYSYLTKKRDSKTEAELTDLRDERKADKWIRISPSAFCNTKDEKILSQVLNDYDRETVNFYRWKVTYTQEELSALVKERSGIDFGMITDLIPIERGTSGRLVKLKIVGTKCTMIIGKELEIRRTLSASHLYSSAFVVDKDDNKFILIGAGWGHGVGLCQIGAAMMGEQGYLYDEILLHYYIGVNIETLY